MRPWQMDLLYAVFDGPMALIGAPYILLSKPLRSFGWNRYTPSRGTAWTVRGLGEGSSWELQATGRR